MSVLKELIEAIKNYQVDNVKQIIIKSPYSAQVSSEALLGDAVEAIKDTKKYLCSKRAVDSRK
jgi:hypothetical protein